MARVTPRQRIASHFDVPLVKPGQLLRSEPVEVQERIWLHLKAVLGTMYNVADINAKE